MASLGSVVLLGIVLFNLLCGQNLRRFLWLLLARSLDVATPHYGSRTLNAMFRKPQDFCHRTRSSHVHTTDGTGVSDSLLLLRDNIFCVSANSLGPLSFSTSCVRSSAKGNGVSCQT